MPRFADFSAEARPSRRPLPVRLETNGQARDFLRFHTYPPGEMFFEVAGFKATRGTITLEYPERRGTDSGTQQPSSYSWHDVSTTTFALDHISVHADRTFHLKERSSGVHMVVGPKGATITEATGRFLEMHVFSDSADRYRAFSDVQPNDESAVVIPCAPRGAIHAHVLFAGADCPLEQLVAQMTREPVVPAIALQASLIRGLGVVRELPSRGPPQRPEGTLLALRMFYADEEFIEKAYHVS